MLLVLQNILHIRMAALRKVILVLSVTVVVKHGSYRTTMHRSISQINIFSVVDPSYAPPS